MPIIIVKGTRPGWSMAKIKKVICCKKRAKNQANDIHNAPDECLHNFFLLLYTPCAQVSPSQPSWILWTFLPIYDGPQKPRGAIKVATGGLAFCGKPSFLSSSHNMVSSSSFSSLYPITCSSWLFSSFAMLVMQC